MIGHSITITLLFAIINNVNADITCSVHGYSHILRSDGIAKVMNNAHGLMQMFNGTIGDNQVGVQCAFADAAGVNKNVAMLTECRVLITSAQHCSVDIRHQQRNTSRVAMFGQRMNVRQITAFAAQRLDKALGVSVFAIGNDSVSVEVHSGGKFLQIVLAPASATITGSANVNSCSGLCGTCSGPQTFLKPYELPLYQVNRSMAIQAQHQCNMNSTKVPKLFATPEFHAPNMTNAINDPEFASAAVMDAVVRHCSSNETARIASDPLFGSFVEDCIVDKSVGPSGAEMGKRDMEAFTTLAENMQKSSVALDAFAANASAPVCAACMKAQWEMPIDTAPIMSADVLNGPEMIPAGSGAVYQLMYSGNKHRLPSSLYQESTAVPRKVEALYPDSSVPTLGPNNTATVGPTPAPIGSTVPINGSTAMPISQTTPPTTAPNSTVEPVVPVATTTPLSGNMAMPLNSTLAPAVSVATTMPASQTTAPTAAPNSTLAPVVPAATAMPVSQTTPNATVAPVLPTMAPNTTVAPVPAATTTPSSGSMAMSVNSTLAPIVIVATTMPASLTTAPSAPTTLAPVGPVATTSPSLLPVSSIAPTANNTAMPVSQTAAPTTAPNAVIKPAATTSAPNSTISPDGPVVSTTSPSIPKATSSNSTTGHIAASVNQTRGPTTVPGASFPPAKVVVTTAPVNTPEIVATTSPANKTVAPVTVVPVNKTRIGAVNVTSAAPVTPLPTTMTIIVNSTKPTKHPKRTFAPNIPNSPFFVPTHKPVNMSMTAPPVAECDCMIPVTQVEEARNLVEYARDSGLINELSKSVMEGKNPKLLAVIACNATSELGPIVDVTPEMAANICRTCESSSPKSFRNHDIKSMAPVSSKTPVILSNTGEECSDTLVPAVGRHYGRIETSSGLRFNKEPANRMKLKDQDESSCESSLTDQKRPLRITFSNY